MGSKNSTKRWEFSRKLIKAAVERLPESSRVLLNEYFNKVGLSDPETVCACIDLVMCMTDDDVEDVKKYSTDEAVMEVLQRLGYQGHYPNNTPYEFRIVGDDTFENKEAIKRCDAHNLSATLYKVTFEGQPVVLKVSTVTERFFREVAAYATLGDKYPFKPLALYHQGERYGLVLPFLEDPLQGHNLNNIARNVFFGARESLEIIHSCGLIHGDVKVENMMIYNGKVVMIDFEHTVSMRSTIPTLQHPLIYRPHKDDYPTINYQVVGQYSYVRKDDMKVPHPDDDYYALCKVVIHLTQEGKQVGERWEISAWKRLLDLPVFDGEMREYCLKMFRKYH